MKGYWVGAGGCPEVELRIGLSPIEFYEDLPEARSRAIDLNVAARKADSDAHYGVLEGDSESGPYDRKKEVGW